jgi:hypothetical protein
MTMAARVLLAADESRDRWAAASAVLSPSESATVRDVSPASGSWSLREMALAAAQISQRWQGHK